MRRKTFDVLATIAGLVLAVILAVAGGLMLWGHNFVTDQVHTQLAAQKIIFPAANSAAIKELPAADATAMKQYAGQLMTTGAQANVYANHFIAVHLQGIGGGKTYSQLSAAAMANPKDAVLAGKVATMFKGETLRSMLLNAYAFGTMATIMVIGAWVAFGGAILMLLLSIGGLVHLRRVPAEQEMFTKHTAVHPATAH
jgi:hypothetical protein